MVEGPWMGDTMTGEPMTIAGKIQKWLDAFVANSSTQRDDLHIDQLDARYRSREKWATGR